MAHWNEKSKENGMSLRIYIFWHPSSSVLREKIHSVETGDYVTGMTRFH